MTSARSAEDYAEHHRVRVRFGTQARRVSAKGEGWLVETDGGGGLVLQRLPDGSERSIAHDALRSAADRTNGQARDGSVIAALVAEPLPVCAERA
jgi:hypothetical protein